MAKSNWTLILISAAVLGFAGYSLTGSDPPKPTKPPTRRSNLVSVNDSVPEFSSADFGLHFEHPKKKLKNVFAPAVSAIVGSGHSGFEPLEIDRIPSALADGQADWAFTGIAEIDGKRMALLENTSKHEGGFVEEGDHWKTSRIRRITSESVVFTDKDGIEQVVMRYQADKVEKQPGTTAPGPQNQPPPSNGPPPGQVMPGLPPGFRGRIRGPVMISAGGGG